MILIKKIIANSIILAGLPIFIINSARQKMPGIQLEYPESNSQIFIRGFCEGTQRAERYITKIYKLFGLEFKATHVYIMKYN